MPIRAVAWLLYRWARGIRALRVAGELVRIELDEPHDRDERFWTGEVVEVVQASDVAWNPRGLLPGPGHGQGA